MRKIIAMLFCIASLYSCKKNQVKTPDFDVLVEKQTYKVNEVVNFDFKGNPDIITFYSGEPNKVYANSQRISALSKTTMDFITTSSGGNQLSSLSLLVSTDFLGKGADNTGTISNISKATWTDITNRATLSNGASTPSGTIDLTDFATAGKPVYVAFKYTATSGSIQRKWTVTNPRIVNTLPDLTAFTLADYTSAAIANNGNSNIISPGWLSVNVLNTYNWALSSNTFTITGATTASAATSPAEAWLFTGPVDLTRTVPDFGVVVKDITNGTVPYSYVFKAPGVYKATFVATNSNQDESKTQFRELTITVEK
jgi:hypothetical protein